MVMSVGFQLSYLAVLGIVRFQPGLYLLWEPNSRLWDEIWKITSVSIAAQLATFSLSLFYFNQFPNYFLLANLFVIPLSFVVLLMGIGIIAVGYFGMVASALGWLLEWIIRFMNEGVFIVERLPFSVLDNVHISVLQCCILILLVVLAHNWIETKKSTPLIIASSLCILYSMDQWIHIQKNVTENKITFYNIPGHTAVDLMGSGKSFFLADSVLERDALKIRFNVLPGRLAAGVRNVMPGTALSRKLHGCSVMVWNQQTILQIQKASFSAPPNLTVDFVIISNTSVKSMSDLLKKVKAKAFIIDSSNSFRNADRLLKESELLNINVISLQHHGAYITMV
jgi:competence protein ComEC